MSTSKSTTKKTISGPDTKVDRAPIKDRSTLIISCILLITAIVFSNSIDNGFIINWDDDGYILNNPLIRDLSWNGIKTIFTVPHIDNYHPLTTLSNAIEFSFYNTDPKPYHVINLFLHLINTLLVFSVAKALSGRMEVAAITAVFFGIHPMHVESVAWVSERKDLLYAFFFLLSLLFYHRFIIHKKNIHWVIAFILFVCSLLSKPAAVALSPLLLLIDYYCGRKITLVTLLEKIPFFLFSLLFGILAMRIQQASGSTDLVPVFPIVEKFFMVSYAISYYLLEAVAPSGLSAIHLYPTPGSLPWMYYAAPVFLLLLVFAIYKSGTFRKELVFGFLFFLITIALVIQIVPVGRAIVAERYTYIPYVGLFFMVGQYYCRMMDSRLTSTKPIRPYLNYVLAGCCLFFLLLTWNRNKVWKDSYSLFTAAIETDPKNYFAYMSRARGEFLSENNKGAAADYSEVIRLKPDFTDAYYSRGVVNEKINVADAMADYTTAIRLSPTNDRAFYNRGNLKINAADYAGAMADYDAAIRIHTGLHKTSGKKSASLQNAEDIEAQSYCNRGVAKFNLGQLNEAILDYSEAIRLNPSLSNAYSNRGNAAFNIGNKRKACDDWHKASELGYASAQTNIDQYCR